MCITVKAPPYDEARLHAGYYYIHMKAKISSSFRAILILPVNLTPNQAHFVPPTGGRCETDYVDIDFRSGAEQHSQSLLAYRAVAWVDRHIRRAFEHERVLLPFYDRGVSSRSGWHLCMALIELAAYLGTLNLCIPSKTDFFARLPAFSIC